LPGRAAVQRDGQEALARGLVLAGVEQRGGALVGVVGAQPGRCVGRQGRGQHGRRLGGLAELDTRGRAVGEHRVLLGQPARGPLRRGGALALALGQGLAGAVEGVLGAVQEEAVVRRGPLGLDLDRGRAGLGAGGQPGGDAGGVLVVAGLPVGRGGAHMPAVHVERRGLGRAQRVALGRAPGQRQVDAPVAAGHDAQAAGGVAGQGGLGDMVLGGVGVLFVAIAAAGPGGGQGEQAAQAGQRQGQGQGVGPRVQRAAGARGVQQGGPLVSGPGLGREVVVARGLQADHRGFVGGGAGGLPAIGAGKVPVACQQGAQGGVVAVHAEGHGHDLVGGQAVHPGVARAPGGQGGHRQRDLGRQPRAQRAHHLGQEGPLRAPHLEVELQRVHRLALHQAQRGGHDGLALGGGEGGVVARVGVHMQHRQQHGAGRDAQRLGARPDVGGLAAQPHRGGQPGHAGVRRQAAQVLGPLPGPQHLRGQLGQAGVRRGPQRRAGAQASGQAQGQTQGQAQRQPGAGQPPPGRSGRAKGRARHGGHSSSGPGRGPSTARGVARLSSPWHGGPVYCAVLRRFARRFAVSGHGPGGQTAACHGVSFF
jgi:hypothetical protein